MKYIQLMDQTEAIFYYGKSNIKLKKAINHTKKKYHLMYFIFFCHGDNANNT